MQSQHPSTKMSCIIVTSGVVDSLFPTTPVGEFVKWKRKNLLYSIQ